jgi:serine phosphatase RsbU (regulator of sigma subunit)
MKQSNWCLSFFLLCTSFIALFSITLSAQTPELDRLKSRLQISSLPDTARLNTLISICGIYVSETNNKHKVTQHLPELNRLAVKCSSKRGNAYYRLFENVCNFRKGNSAVVIQNYAAILKLMKEIGDQKGIAKCYFYIGLAHYHTGKYKEAIEYDLQSIQIKSAINDRVGIASSYSGIGSSYYMLGDYQKAIDYYFKALKIDEEVNEKFGISKIQLNVGCVLFTQGRASEALSYMEKSLKTKLEINELEGVSYVYLNMAAVYNEKKEYPKAIECCLNAIDAAEKAQSSEALFTSYINLGGIYNAQDRPDEALACYLKAYKDSFKTNNKVNMIAVTAGIGNCYEQKKDYNSAIEYYKKAFQTSQEINYKAGIKEAYVNLSLLYEKLGNYKEALTYDKLLSAIKDTLLNEESMKQTAELNTRYETEKKEKEILLLTKDQQLKDKTLKEQRLVRIGLIIGLGLFLTLSFLLFNRYRFKQKANVLLEKQKQEIHQKNIFITDSIDYAKTIQEAILPDTDKLNAFFPQHFILYKPKDIVSGDFYWIGKKDDQLICAVADCTGHGVPGAFMSLLGHNILENVIQQETSIDPGSILTALNKEIVNRFSKGKEQETVKHGMDIALISMNLATQQLQYAGARNSLYLIRNKVLTEMKADKRSTGIVAKDHIEVSYTNNTYDLQKGDLIYLFSDGFPDQKGGPEKKKFYYQPFKDLLLSISGFSVEEQKQRLNVAITNWIGTDEQIDDILIMGIHIGNTDAI